MTPSSHVPSSHNCPSLSPSRLSLIRSALTWATVGTSVAPYVMAHHRAHRAAPNNRAHQHATRHANTGASKPVTTVCPTTTTITGTTTATGVTTAQSWTMSTTTPTIIPTPTTTPAANQYVNASLVDKMLPLSVESVVLLNEGAICKTRILKRIQLTQPAHQCHHHFNI